MYHRALLFADIVLPPYCWHLVGRAGSAFLPSSTEVAAVGRTTPGGVFAWQRQPARMTQSAGRRLPVHSAAVSRHFLRKTRTAAPAKNIATGKKREGCLLPRSSGNGLRPETGWLVLYGKLKGTIHVQLVSTWQTERPRFALLFCLCVLCPLGPISSQG